MLLHSSDLQPRLRTARRVFGLVPIAVFLLTLVIFAAPVAPSAVQFLHLLLRSVVTSLATSFVCIAAYGFYRYLIERSPGL